MTPPLDPPDVVGSSTAFARLGAPALAAIIDDFTERVCTDTMIGFFFRSVDRDRLKQLEFQFAARALGATDVPYEGRPLRAAHAPHPIRGGQFARRTRILADTLRDHEVPADIQMQWLAHVEKLRGQITGEADSTCDPPAPVGPVRVSVDADGNESVPGDSL